VTSIEARNWLRDVIAGRAIPTLFNTCASDFAGLLVRADAEGVSTMIASALNKRVVDWNIPSAALANLTAAFSAQARVATLASMQLEALTREVLSTHMASRQPALLLKGSALAHWAYEQPHLRACSDVDILLPSRSAAEALSARLNRQRLPARHHIGRHGGL
jgi:hypothetical protein